MMRTYKAAQVREPGKLNLVELPIREPGPGQVRLRVEACGVCHSDAATVEGQFPSLTLPRVPGHEVVGRIDAVGLDVSNWKIGQRVGVGFFGGQDGQCQPCQRGDFVNCAHPVVTGITADGGYAEVMIAEARALASIPDELTSAEAAPLLCAGITTYNALRNAGLRAGDLVGIQGIGGRSIYGSLTGSAIDTQDTLAFSVLQDVRPMIETLPLEKAPEAYARMMDGKARFRMVLVTKNSAAPSAR